MRDYHEGREEHEESLVKKFVWRICDREADVFQVLIAERWPNVAAGAKRAGCVAAKRNSHGSVDMN